VEAPLAVIVTGAPPAHNVLLVAVTVGVGLTTTFAVLVPMHPPAFTVQLTTNVPDVVYVCEGEVTLLTIAEPSPKFHENVAVPPVVLLITVDCPIQTGDALNVGGVAGGTVTVTAAVFVQLCADIPVTV
jgi:hypothetical protein